MVIRKKANKIVSKYCGLHRANELQSMYDELKDIGIEVGMVQNHDFQTGNIDGLADVYYNNSIVSNSKFVYQVYEEYYDANGKYEFNMYFS